MKHIAVYFSGRCDGYQYCIKDLKQKFFDNYKIDFFWSIDEEKETPYYEKLKHLLNPIATDYKKVDKKIIDIPISSQETRQRNTLSMFYHNHNCTNMILEHAHKNNISYHCIVRFRIEVVSENDFTIADNLLENTVYIPHGYNYRGVSDRIAYGTVNSMIVYGNLYLHIPNYVFARHAIFNPEYLLMFHINENNMNLIRFPYTFKLHPSRHKIESKHIENQQEDL